MVVDQVAGGDVSRQHHAFSWTVLDRLDKLYDSFVWDEIEVSVRQPSELQCLLPSSAIFVSLMEAALAIEKMPFNPSLI